MGAWGFVSLAYGIVCTVLVVYWFFLKRRYRQAETELDLLKSEQKTYDHEKN